MTRSRQCLFALSLLVGFAATQPSMAQMYPMDSDVGVDGEELFKVCSFCHGTQGQGGPALDAPALAGMEAWYVERQLHNFRNRVRGTHYDDVPGVQMSIVSGMVRNQATIENIAAYIQSLEPGAPPELTRQGGVAGTARPPGTRCATGTDSTRWRCGHGSTVYLAFTVRRSGASG